MTRHRVTRSQTKNLGKHTRGWESDESILASPVSDAITSHVEFAAIIPSSSNQDVSTPVAQLVLKNPVTKRWWEYFRPDATLGPDWNMLLSLLAQPAAQSYIELLIKDVKSAIREKPVSERRPDADHSCVTNAPTQPTEPMPPPIPAQTLETFLAILVSFQTLIEAASGVRVALDALPVTSELKGWANTLKLSPISRHGVTAVSEHLRKLHDAFAIHEKPRPMKRSRNEEKTPGSSEQ
jgi:hypothetical protein